MWSVPGRVNQDSLVFLIVFFECVGFSLVVVDLVCSAILPSDWLAELCPNGVSLHKDQLLQDPLTFKQNS